MTHPSHPPLLMFLCFSFEQPADVASISPSRYTPRLRLSSHTSHHTPSHHTPFHHTPSHHPLITHPPALSTASPLLAWTELGTGLVAVAVWGTMVPRQTTATPRSSSWCSAPSSSTPRACRVYWGSGERGWPPGDAPPPDITS